MPAKNSSSAAPRKARKVAAMTAAEVVSAVRKHYKCEVDDPMGPEWASLDEFSLAPGGGRGRIDLLMVRAWGGAPKRHERHAIEVKVSRSDFLAELAQPGKRFEFERCAHRFFFAAPAGLIDPDELPEGVGLLEVTGRGVKRVRQGAKRTPDDMSERAFVEAFRRASRAEARIRGAGEEDLAAQAAANAAATRKAQAAELRAKNALAAERARVMRLLDHIAMSAVAPCRCGGRVKAQRGRGYGGIDWVHVEGGDECRWASPQLEVYLEELEAQLDRGDGPEW